MRNTMNTAQLKEEVIANMETVRGLRYGLTVAEMTGAFSVSPQIVTQAFEELVAEGVLIVARQSRGVNVYAAASMAR